MKKISVRGPIIASDDQRIYDYFGIEATSPKKVSDILATVSNGEDIEVEINSGGGDVFSGSEIYTSIKSMNSKVTVKILGIAASAASVIAMAGSKGCIKIAPTAQLMIHNVTTGSSGDYRAMEHSADVLKKANETIANAYQIQTGKSQEELLSLMDNETWLTPKIALDMGFVDEILFTEPTPKMVASIGQALLPNEVIEKMRNVVLNPQTENNQSADFLMQSKLNFLKLKGVAND